MFTLVLFLIGVTQVLFRCVRSGEVAAGTKAMQIRKSSGALSFLPPGFLRFFRVELKYYAAFLIRLDHFFTFEAPTYWYSRSRATCVEFTSWYLVPGGPPGLLFPLPHEDVTKLHLPRGLNKSNVSIESKVLV
jgi:hypothetical protein